MKLFCESIAFCAMVFYCIPSHAEDIQDIYAIDQDTSNLQFKVKVGKSFGIKLKGAAADVDDCEVTFKNEGIISRGNPKCEGDDNAHFCQSNFILAEATQLDILNIKTKTGGTNCTKTASLPASFNQEPWSIQYSGGFVGSNVVSPNYIAKKTGATTTIVRDRDSEDSVSMGLAAFTHVCYNQAYNYATVSDSFVKGALRAMTPCLSLGIGISNNGTNDLSYYPGISYGLGEAAYLTLGVSITKVNALPNALKEGDTIADANEISNMSKKTEHGFFVGISYSFMGSTAKTTLENAYKPTP